MQILNAKDLFNSIKNIDNTEFEASRNIVLDFSNIENVDLKVITSLLNLQKVALLNNKSLSISNVKPNILNMLEVTGLNKTISNVATNPLKRG